MKLIKLANKIGAALAPVGGGASEASWRTADAEVTRFYAGDRVSDLLNEASDSTLIVSNLPGSQLIRVAELFDVPGICLLNGAMPGPDLLKAAMEHGAVFIVSPVGMTETCERINRCFLEEVGRA